MYSLGEPWGCNVVTLSSKISDAEFNPRRLSPSPISTISYAWETPRGAPQALPLPSENWPAHSGRN